MEGVEAWNHWRKQNPDARPDLSEANLLGSDLRCAQFHGVDLCEANLSRMDLGRANFSKAYLLGADLSNATLSHGNLTWSNLDGANLSGADFREAELFQAKLNFANLNGANLSEARLIGATLNAAKLVGAILIRAKISDAQLVGANLSGADLSGASLNMAMLCNTNLEGATLTNCSVYGISVWNVNLRNAAQKNLVITPNGESPIQVDNLEVAQFIYLLLNNEKIRSVIDTITSKVVLILGRFTPGRKAVLDAIRNELRKRDYLPVLFDFEKPTSKDLTGTISTLASMARFIIADLTDPNSVPHELATVIPATVVPVQAIILKGQRPYPMFVDLRKRYRWVLKPYQYDSEDMLIAQLGKQVIAPAEAKAKILVRK
jgi:uncharacterized protein YjbI with pentapeptide repeats